MDEIAWLDPEDVQRDKAWEREFPQPRRNMKKPTYEELANGFAEYLAATSNDGGVPGMDTKIPGNPPLATILKKKERRSWEGQIERAASLVDAAGGSY